MTSSSALVAEISRTLDQRPVAMVLSGAMLYEWLAAPLILQGIAAGVVTPER